MILVVGGHSRNIGKTSVVANLVRAFPDRHWTAVKITQFGHGVCTASGDGCECATDPDHPFAITRERDPSSGTDTARYLAAGARESLWLRTRQRELGFAMLALRRVLDRSPDVILESNSVMQFLNPDVYLVVLDPATADFKPSSHLFLDRASAFLLPGESVPHRGSGWMDVAPRLLAGRPHFQLAANYEVTPEILAFVASRAEARLHCGYGESGSRLGHP